MKPHLRFGRKRARQPLRHFQFRFPLITAQGSERLAFRTRVAVRHTCCPKMIVTIAAASAMAVRNCTGAYEYRNDHGSLKCVTRALRGSYSRSIRHVLRDRLIMPTNANGSRIDA